jgi:transposase
MAFRASRPALDFGRPPEHDLREIMDAILYVDRTGAQWRYLLRLSGSLKRRASR